MTTNEVTFALSKLAVCQPWKWLTSVITGGVAYILPTEQGRQMFLAAGCLIIIDSITGLWAARVNKQRWSSAKFSRVLSKLLGYTAVLAVVAVATRHLPLGASIEEFSSVVVLTGIMITEAISVLENVEKMDIDLPFGLLARIRALLGKEAPPKGTLSGGGNSK